MLTVRHVHAYKAFIKIKATVLNQSSSLESTVVFLIKDTLRHPGVLTRDPRIQSLGNRHCYE